ncbi:MAG: chemotaxis protein CheA [Xanthomonadaceae bacterium]|nr:chemotaxis protein CheA [Xanthomonadaceae bacterium]MDP2185549.1 chemotaxis protein CheA [Xanthomonadales bacterium]MDZ4115238.1 chemotaxis protein CheA [Xanthomonadaceae bacterium]MDZ4377601.1 chemotaxis protein CheA [Xanthomonadaceae bacterium]
MDSAFEAEILADFLVEAGELVAGLGDQLLALEDAPDSPELLNAVFRAFHTVKGGAGFLAIDPMVKLCHRGEDLLNEARSGRVRLHADYIDALLNTLDCLQQMMASLRAGAVITPAPSALLDRLLVPAARAKTSAATATEPVAVSSNQVHSATPEKVCTSDAVEGEFEALLAMVGVDMKPVAQANGDPIDDSEFEALLDELYGPGKVPGQVEQSPGADAATNAAPMTDDEFEALLDSFEGNHAHTDNAQPAVAKTPAGGAVKLPDEWLTSAGNPLAEGAATTRNAAPLPADTTIRVDTGRLDALVNLIGELVLVRNRLAVLSADSSDERTERAVAELHRVADDLQLAVMRTRMLPIGKLFGRFPRIVRDISRQLGKRIDLVLEGEDTDLDRNLVDALADPMVHLVRNALDHGIETPEDRLRVGKNETGTLRLIAAQEGERIVIRVRDDGRGMDPDVLRNKALEKGLLNTDQAERLSEAECFDLIFLAGFSTRQEVSDISGRGVGMDVVKTRVAELGGTLAIASELGRGSEIQVSLPLTLATLRALMVRINGRVYAIPMINVLEVFELDPRTVSRVDDRDVIAHRNRALPLRHLGAWLDPSRSTSEARGHVVVVHVGHRQLGCVVDQVIGRDEMVVKPLGRLLHGVQGVSGATITGDGRVALVLNVAQLPDAVVASDLVAGVR